MTEKEKARNAKAFAKTWENRGYEKGESQTFWLSLLRDVLGVERPEEHIIFEEQVYTDTTKFIDAYLPETKILIEQKSLGKDLNKSIRQSDGTRLTPYQQALRYMEHLKFSQYPRWIVTCNFAEFYIYDNERPGSEPEKIALKNLDKDYYRLSFLISSKNPHLEQEQEISIKAGELVGKLYDLLYQQYDDPITPQQLQDLNKLCVRLVFCLYAEDAGIFGKKEMFYDYLKKYDAEDSRHEIARLFETLNTKEEDREHFLKPSLAQFPYVNGGLFADRIEVPPFTEEIRDLLLNRMSLGFDWSQISPTIFGAVFESTLNPETRRKGGMHYTSIENIHKVIDPLFLNELKEELEQIESTKTLKTRNHKLTDFQKKLASLNFLDPACGSGNFLTETYLSLRRLENRIITDLNNEQMIMGAMNPIQISISQFYGIEINDFAVTVAKTALWIAESQTMKETESIVQMDLDFLPLKTNAHIHEGNALQLDWSEVIPKDQLNYIFGNPPFVGARLMSSSQKQDIQTIFNGWKNLGNLDYVSGWYKKTSDFLADTPIRAALVSTNSISQGEAVGNLWAPLFREGVHIDFAYRTFRWDSEASSKAHVHCVIIGFSKELNPRPKMIYDGEKISKAKNINGYLLDAPNISVKSRNQPICNVPKIRIGNKPIDGGFYLFDKQEMESFLQVEPKAQQYFHPWYGSKEFINRKPRYCLWLGDCTPSELKQMPQCLKRIEAVREYRLKSPSAGTRKLAEKPTRFHVENMPKSTYVVIPEVSSEKRRYVPMGFMTPDILCSNKLRLMPMATLYHFGLLESNVHMAWMRVVCGRLKSDYDYSIKIVYNNFPWPNPTESQKAKITHTAQGILDARNLYPDSSLADLYDELTMPVELRNAHRANDKAVLEAYGIKPDDSEFTSESACVAFLMKQYQKLINSV